MKRVFAREFQYINNLLWIIFLLHNPTYVVSAVQFKMSIEIKASRPVIVGIASNKIIGEAQRTCPMLSPTYTPMSVQIVTVGLMTLFGQLQGCINLSHLPYQLAPYTGQVDTE